MYRHLLRPLLFLFSPEGVHNFAMRLLGAVGANRAGRWFLSRFFSLRDPRLETEVFGIRFPNPVGVAAGYDKNARLYEPLSSMGFGFVETGTVTPRPQQGNLKPRMFRLPADRALVNRMGFNNGGMETALRNLRRRGRPHRVIVGANIAKNSLTSPENAAADYLKLFRNLYQYVDYFTVNIRCPMSTGFSGLHNRETISAILAGLFEFRRGQNQYRPVLVKVPPDLSWEEVDRIVDILLETPLDGLVVGGTTTSRTGLKTPEKTLEQIGTGGLSGAPLTGLTLGMVRYINTRTEGRYPLIAVGGIMSPSDAAALLDAGASLVQVYTGMVYNGPSFARRICRELLEREERTEK